MGENIYCRYSFAAFLQFYFFGGGFGLGTPVVSYAPLPPMVDDSLSDYEKRRRERGQTDVFIVVVSEA